MVLTDISFLLIEQDVLVSCLGVDVKKNVIVTVSADKGLCGGINSTSVKISRALFKLNSGIYQMHTGGNIHLCLSLKSQVD